MTAATRNTGARFRTRKLSTKQSLQIVYEDQIDAVDDEQRNIAQVETGVERSEEIEHHLQAAISASQAAIIGGKVAQTFIPTPDASKTVDQYEKLYPKKFSQPASYIRFSSTVEDTSGCLYSIGEEDDQFLQKLNSKKSPGSVVKEDVLEAAIQYFEATTALKQPFLGLENDDATAHLLSYEDLESNFDENQSPAVRQIAKQVYPYWTEQRLKKNGQTILPSLKFEQGQVEKDDGDPYVCFRRREHRPARKTRRTDAQSIEKLKKLRLDMEKGRHMVQCIVEREQMKKQSVELDSMIFQRRAIVKETKRRLGIKGDDEDLVNRPRKQRPTEAPVPVARPAVRHDGRPPEADLRQLDDVIRAQKQNTFKAVLDNRVRRQQASIGQYDRTLDFISSSSPIEEESVSGKGFRSVRSYYLPSPPPSEDSNSSPDSMSHHRGMVKPQISFQTVSTISKREREERSPPPSFRRRVGRGGRLMIDRRGIKLRQGDRDSIEDIVLDRFKYDQDSEDEDEFTSFHSGFGALNSDRTLQFRANLFMTQLAQERRAKEEGLAAKQSESTNTTVTTSTATVVPTLRITTS